MNEITLNAFAKINLHLEVTGKLPNGYHSIESIFHSISLSDVLTLKKHENALSLTCSDASLPCTEQNLVMRAARAFFEEAQFPGGASIHLIKRIPIQAGLGGGSSDAAATLRGLNLLYDSPLSEDALYRLASSLGADVPFCLRGRSALATGIGDSLLDCPPLPPCHIVVGIGEGDKMSTSSAYSALDGLSFRAKSCTGLMSALGRGDFDKICAHLFNRFSVLNPSAERGMERLRSLGARAALLCGSGAAFFGLFRAENQAEAQNAAEILKKEGYRAWVTVPIG